MDIHIGTYIYKEKIAKWSTAVDCKSIDIILVGSNPTFLINFNKKKKSKI